MVKRFLLVAAVFVFAWPTVQAEVVFRESFDGSSDDPLGLTVPDVSQAGVAWVSDLDTFTADGRRGASGGGSNASLAFAPEAGNRYTLDLQLRDVVGATQWWGYGFTDRGDRNSARGVFDDSRFNLGRAWSLVRGDQFNRGDFVANSANQNGQDISTDWSAFNNSNGSSFDLDVRIVLDTTSSVWSAEHFAKEPDDTTFTLVATQPTIANQSTIDAVGFAVSSKRDAIDGRVGLFELSVASVPEPTCSALLGLAVLARGTGRRRRRSLVVA
jgi:MYXO-CTERM domain-containing protein